MSNTALTVVAYKDTKAFGFSEDQPISRTRHDQFAKELLAGLLETVGTAQAEVEVTSEVRRIDLLFVPLPDKAADRDALGLLGRIAATRCLIEPYRNPPANEEIRACLLRLFIQYGERQRQARRQNATLKEADYELLWVVGPTISRTVLAGLGARPNPQWPAGVYFAAQTLRTVLVAVHQLEAGRDTLWLRVLGRGTVQQQAITELLALPQEDPLRELALKLLNQWKIRTEQQNELSQDEQELLMNLSPAYLEWEQKTLQQGRQEGRQEAQQEAERRILLRQLTRKFGPLDTQVVEQIQSITQTEKLEQLADALIDAPDLQSFLQQL